MDTHHTGGVGGGEMSKFLDTLRLSGRKIKVEKGLTNYQIVNPANPKKGASIVEHRDGTLNVVNRQGVEEYDGNVVEDAIQAIFRIIS